MSGIDRSLRSLSLKSLICKQRHVFLLRFLFAIIVQKEHWNAQNRLFSMVISVCSVMKFPIRTWQLLYPYHNFQDKPGSKGIWDWCFELPFVAWCFPLLATLLTFWEEWRRHTHWPGTVRNFAGAEPSSSSFSLIKPQGGCNPWDMFFSFWNGLKNDVYTNTCLHAKTIIYSYIQRLRGQ